MKTVLAIALVFSLSACVYLSPNIINSDQANATVTIYRSDQLQGSAVDIYVGWAGHYHIALAPEENTDVQVVAGLQTHRRKPVGSLCLS